LHERVSAVEEALIKRVMHASQYSSFYAVLGFGWSTAHRDFNMLQN